MEHITTDDPPLAVAQVIGWLCGAGEVPYDDVVVLSPHPLKSSLVGNAKTGAFVFTTHAFGHVLSAD